MPPGGLPGARPSARGRLWVRALHRWLGLAVGAVLLVSASTGLWLALLGPADKRQIAALCGDAPAVVNHQALVDAVRERLGPLTSLTLRMPHGERACVTAFAKTASWHGELFLHPATARIVAQREDSQGLYNLMFELHSNLLLGDTGKALLAVVGAVFAALLASGLIVWWPARWSTALQMRWRGRRTVALADGHRLAGALLGLLVLSAVASGTYVVWRPLAGWVNSVASTPRAGPPMLPRQIPDTPNGAAPAPPLDALVRAGAGAAGQGARLVDIGLPVGKPGPVRLRYHLPGDPHPNGQSYVWLDPRQGAVLQRTRWDEADLGSRLQGWLYPFHAGQLWGVPHTALLLLFGISLSWFTLSGPLLWWLRRRALDATHRQPPPSGNPS